MNILNISRIVSKIGIIIVLAILISFFANKINTALAIIILSLILFSNTIKWQYFKFRYLHPRNTNYEKINSVYLQLKEIQHILQQQKIKKTTTCMVAGFTGSGKTTLILNANLPLISASNYETTCDDAENFELQEKNPFEVNWYLTKDILFVEVPENFINENVAVSGQNAWGLLLKLFSFYKFQFLITHLIITANLQQILKQTNPQKQLQMHLLKQRLAEINCYYPYKLYTDIIITNSDQIEGFSDFFSHINKSEQENSFGINFQPHDTTAISKQFLKNFDELTQNLEQHLITKIHQIHNEETRIKILNFPFEFAKHKKTLRNFIHQVVEKGNFKNRLIPNGIFFTASFNNQSDTRKILTQLNISNTTFNSNIETLFIRNIFNNISNFGKNKITTQKRNSKLVQATSLASVAILTSLGLTWSGFHYLNHPTLSLQQQLSNHTSLVATVEHPRNNDILLNKIQINLEKILETNTDPFIQYGTLKAYIALNQQNIPENELYLKNWLHYLIQNKQIELQDNIDNIAQGSNVSLNLKQQLIITTKKKLEKLPSDRLAYIIFKNINLSALQHNISLYPNVDKQSQNFSIPFFYTNIQLLNIIKMQQNALQKQILVNANSINLSLNFAKIDLKNAILTAYLDEYAQNWQQIINQFSQLPSDNLPDLAATIQQYLTTPNGLQQLFNVVLLNIDSQNILSKVDVDIAEQHLITKKLNVFNDFVIALKQIDFSELQNNLNLWLNIYQKISTDGINAFSSASEVFSHENTTTPIQKIYHFAVEQQAPLKNWLLALNDVLWHQTLTTAANYINQQWQQQIYHYYTLNLQYRFPFNLNSQENVDISNFEEFFRPNGLMNHFFNQYLLAFVNVNQTDWSLKTKFNQTLPLSPQALKTFELARIITTMFFPDRSKHINVAFSLQQKAFMPIIKRFNLDINGQTLSDELGTRNISRFFWPGNSSERITQLAMQTVNGQSMHSNETDTWGWFRLLNHSQIKTIRDTQHFDVTFDIDGNETRYLLTTDRPINPFIPGIINQFYCPEDILLK